MRETAAVDLIAHQPNNMIAMPMISAAMTMVNAANKTSSHMRCLAPTPLNCYTSKVFVPRIDTTSIPGSRGSTGAGGIGSDRLFRVGHPFSRIRCT